MDDNPAAYFFGNAGGALVGDRLDRGEPRLTATRTLG
jgi:hypothetical protein